MIMASASVSGVPLMEGALVEGQWPEWFVASRQRGWADFQQLPAPVPKDEKWRFSNVKALALDGFRYPAAVAERRRRAEAERRVTTKPAADTMMWLTTLVSSR